MKWSFNHKSRKAFLTAAICLALSQSVFAMPTGGKVVDGTVTGILDNGTVANGTINVNSNALIDWTAFNIAKGETLNFKFGQDYLNVINHVTGSEMSQLLGTLNAKNGNVYLINPNGISVGGGARIDAGTLVLSTLDATDTQLQDVLKNGLTNLALTGKSDSKGITIENGANITVGPFLGLLGNKVQIADNVTISDASYGSGISKTNLVIAAANEAKLGPSDNDVADISSVTTGQGNTLTIGAANFNIKNEYTDTYFLGNDINMKGTNLNIESGPEGSALDIIAADAYAVNGNETVKLNFSQGNQLNLDNVKASADFMHVIGGKTSIADSDLTLTELKPEFKQGEVAPYMTVAALNGEGIVLDDIEGGVTNVQNTDGATLTIKDSKLTSNENIALWGGSVELTNANLKTLEETNAKNNNIDIDAFTSFGDKEITTDSFNTVKVTGGSLESGGDISVQGSSIAVQGAKLALDGVKDVNSKEKEDKGIFLMAGKQFTFTDDDEYLENNTDANAISVKNTTMSTNDAMALIGDKVDVTDGSNLTAGDLEIVAGSSYKNEGNTIAGTDTTNLTVSDSTIHSNEDLTLVGSNINLANTKLEVGTPTDHEYGSNGVVRIAAAKAVELVDDNNRGFVVGSVDKTGNLTMNKVNLSAQGNVMAFGKTVKIQDSSLSTTNDQDITINAMNTYKRVDGTSDTWTATKDNTMDVTGTTLTNKGIIELSSGKLTMDKSNLTATGKEGAILVDARASYTDDDKGLYVNKVTDGMDVNIKDSNFSGDNGVLVVGNTVTIDGQSSAKSANAKVFFATGQQSEMTDTSIKGNGAPVNVGKDVKYDAKNTEFAPSMKTIETKPTEPTEPTKPDQPTTPTEPTEPTEPTKPDQPTTPTEPTEPTEPTKPDQPTTPTEPTKPDKPIVTPDPKPAVDVKKNIEQGKQDMTKAIADNKDNASAAVKQQAEKLSDSKMTDAEKAAQVKGYTEAIEDSQASVEEKQALVKDTVKSFEPTQQSSIEAQNKQDEAAQNSNAQTVIPNVTVKDVAPAEHEGAAATVTVDGTVVNE